MALSPKQARDLLAALRARLEPDAAAAFLAAIQSIADAIDLKALTEMIQAGRIEEAVAFVTRMRGIYFPFTELARNAYTQGGLFAAAAVPLLRNPLDASRFAFAFDGHHHRAVAWAQENAAKFITNSTEAMKEAARALIVDGIQTNRNAASIARDLVGRVNPLTGKREGGVIGLTAGQTDTLIRSRGDLASGDPKRLRAYLARASRDRTNDALVRRAIDGQRLTAAQVEEVLTGMKNKMLRIRGEVVARNEVFSALSAGQHEGWNQLAESGAVPVAHIEKRWQHNHNKPFRPDHLAMSGKTVRFDQPFILPDGTRMQHDHDPAGGPKQNIGCHCTTFYRLKKGRNDG